MIGAWLWIGFAPILVVLGEWLATARLGSAQLLYISTYITGIAMLAAFAGTVSLPFMVLFKKRHWPNLFVWWVTCLAFLVSIGTGLRLGSQFRMNAFRELGERSAPVVSAIRDFEATHGDIPTKLEDLVPEFFPSVPQTGMRAYPEFRYYANKVATEYYRNPWVLVVNTPSGGFNFDRFVYFPLQNYPEWGKSGWYEVLGEWAYYHE